MYLINRCAISKKELQESDDVVSFPVYDSKPDEPEFFLCENIALRSKFEKWHLRDSVIQKVRSFWTQIPQTHKYLLILAQNDSFLISKSTIEKRVWMFFLNHVFRVDFTWDTWEKFEDLILAFEKGNFNTIGEDNLSWEVNSTKCKLTRQIKDGRKDTIVIPMAEWLNLQELLSAE